MSHDSKQDHPVFRIQLAAQSAEGAAPVFSSLGNEVTDLLRQLVEGQDRQNQLLEEMSQQLNASQRQRNSELVQWKAAHPNLARNCRAAAEALGRVQNEFLERLTEDVADNADVLMDGDFMLNEFVDRYGPRLAHLNGVLQVLSQLSNIADPANASQ